FETFLRVRFRIDGALEEIQKIPYKLTPAIVSRIKILAGLDICEKRIPQDGVINFRMEESGADLRVSTLPSAFGEKVVMRVLGTTNLNNDLSKLGIPDHQLKPLRKNIHSPNGLVLVTGPTGSGKTTTLYAGLNELNDISRSVFTAEDPVEGNLPGVTQCQVNNAVGFTFSSILRSFLRQDPDVILVGEIRDQETAEIAIKASLTGHLVLSTLHTNCSSSTIQRLIDIGIAPYLITSSVNCIVAQRLVRRICDSCKEETPVSSEMFTSLGLEDGALDTNVIYRGKGCDSCHGTGFKGRAPVYELLEMNDELRRLVLKGGSKIEVKRLARAYGMQTLRESGLALVKEGLTTIEEVLGRTQEDEEGRLPLEIVKEQLGLGFAGVTEESNESPKPTEVKETQIIMADETQTEEEKEDQSGEESISARWKKAKLNNVNSN
ncbi:MAG: type II/IV secretion system protein, partial [Bdellovibrionales bacterium]|nr:type II/IV secretion system protein [Bdellovibrionales bacterium]